MSIWHDKISQLTSDVLARQQKLTRLQSSMVDKPMALVKNRRYIAVNCEALEHFQCQLNDFIGASPYDFSPRLQSTGRSSFDEIQDKLARCIAGESQEFEWLHLSLQHQELPTQVCLTPFVLDLEPVVLVEISPIDRRQELRTPPLDGFGDLPWQVMSKTLEESTEAVYICDSQNHIVAVNKAMCQISGYSPEQLKGQKPNIFYDDSCQNQEIERHKMIQKRGFWQGEIKKKRKDGSHFDAWFSSRQITTDSGEHYKVALFSDITTKKQLQTKLSRQANYDTLTGLPNRFHLTKLLYTAISNTNSTQGKVGALMFLDLNGFKYVNDSFGHATGDRLLQLVAARLEASCVEDANIARIGGDEFTLILQNCRSIKEVEFFAEQVLAIFSNPFEIGGQKFFIGTSIGITLFPNNSVEPEQLLNQADTAMYCAKQTTTHIKFYDVAMSKAAETKLLMSNALSLALDKNQFHMEYQAIFNLDNSQIAGAEALIRWQYQPDKLIQAAEFIPLLEQIGLMAQVGIWAIEQACHQAVIWQRLGHFDFQITVNVSALQLEHAEFIDQLEAVLEKTGLSARSLTLDVPESALIKRPEQVRNTLLKIKNLGVKIAIDNFGTGLSSLSRLGRLPIDCLKIAPEFAQQLDDRSGRRLYQAIIHMAQALQVDFISEGIESSSQHHAIAGMGCGFGQGHLLAAPLNKVEFTNRYMEEDSNAIASPSSDRPSDSEPELLLA